MDMLRSTCRWLARKSNLQPAAAAQNIQLENNTNKWLTSPLLYPGASEHYSLLVWLAADDTRDAPDIQLIGRR
jgi:hypothetical protein